MPSAAKLAGLVVGYMAEGQGVYSGVTSTFGPSVLTACPLTTVPSWASLRIVPYFVRVHLLAGTPPMLGTAQLLEAL